MVLTFFSMNQVVFALLYCSSFQHCVQIKEKTPHEHSEWIHSPPPFTLQGQHLLPNASLKLAHKGELEHIRNLQAGRASACFDVGMVYLFDLPDHGGLPAADLHAYISAQQMQEGGGVTAAAGPFSTAERLGRVTESF